MSICKRCLVVVAVAASTWWLASCWLISSSECFYASVPPAALAFLLTGFGTNPKQNSWTPLRQAASLFIGALLLEVCALSWMFGPGVLQSWRFWAEAAMASYLLGSLFIVLIGFLRLLLSGAQLLAKRWHSAPLVEKVFAPAAALAIFATLAVPFGVAFSMVYRFKVPNLGNPLRDAGKEYEDVEFTSIDGTTLRGWWIPAKSPSDRTIIICHGLAANRSQALAFHEIGDWLGANLFLFDMRGHGDSGGRTVSLGTWEKYDALAAIEYVRVHRSSEARQVIGMGISLGAAAMGKAAAEVEPALTGVILDSGFASTGEMTHHLPCPPFFHSWLLTIGVPVANWNAGCSVMSFSPESSIGQLRAPVVFCHVRHDLVTPSDHSIRLYQQAAEPKQLLLFEAGHHCGGFFVDREKYRAAIQKFADQLARSE